MNVLVSLPGNVIQYEFPPAKQMEPEQKCLLGKFPSGVKRILLILRSIRTAAVPAGFQLLWPNHEKPLGIFLPCMMCTKNIMAAKVHISMPLADGIRIQCVCVCTHTRAHMRTHIKSAMSLWWSQKEKQK